MKIRLTTFIALAVIMSVVIIYGGACILQTVCMNGATTGYWMA